MQLQDIARSVRLKSIFAMLAAAFLQVAVAEPADVRTRALGEVLNESVYSAPATVVARNQPQVAAEIAARVIALPVQVGDRVQADDTLAELDCRSHESRLAVTRAELEVTVAQLGNARAQHTRALNLKKNRNISDELLDQRKLELATRQAEESARREAVRQAEIDVSHCQIRAPFDAVVTDRLVSVGTYLSRGTAVIGLLETSGQEVSAYLRESEIATLQATDDPAFEVGSRRFPLRVRTLLPAIDTNTRTREVRLVFSAEPTIPGTAGRLVWRGRRLTVPADYLVRRRDSLGIFVLHEGRARFVALPGAQEGQAAAVDLPPDTELITEGRWRLRDGQEVRVIPPARQPDVNTP